MKREGVRVRTAALVIVACAMPPALRGQDVQELPHYQLPLPFGYLSTGLV